MNNSETPKPYHRRKTESDNSWRAFNDYLKLTPPRTCKKLHEHYTGAALAEDPPSTKYRTIRHWHYEHEWDKRCKAWDEEQDALHLERLRAVKSEGIEASIQTFTNSVLQSGKSQVAVSLEALKILDALIKSFHAEKDLDNQLKLVNSICNLMRSIPTISASGLEAWATALGVTRLMNEAK